MFKGFVVQSTAGIGHSVDFQHQAMLHFVTSREACLCLKQFPPSSRTRPSGFPKMFFPNISCHFLGPVLGLSAANGCSPFQQLDNLGSFAGVFDLASLSTEMSTDWLRCCPMLRCWPPGCSPWRSRCIMRLKKIFRSWHCGLHMIAPQLQRKKSWTPRTFGWLISTWSFAFSVR